MCKVSERLVRSTQVRKRSTVTITIDIHTYKRMSNRKPQTSFHYKSISEHTQVKYNIFKYTQCRFTLYLKFLYIRRIPLPETPHIHQARVAKLKCKAFQSQTENQTMVQNTLDVRHLSKKVLLNICKLFYHCT